MFKVKELLLSPEIFEDPIFRTHLRCFRWYGYVASKDQKRPWFSLLRCTVFTASIWLSCALMLARVFRGFENLNDGATSWATAVQYFTVSIATLNAYVQRERVISLLRVAFEDIQNLMFVADNREMDLLAATQVYTRTITLILWVPSVIAGLIAYSDCLYRTLFLPKSVFNMAAVRRGEEQPILLFQLFPFRELCDNFVVGFLGPWYAIALGITTVPLWHTFITCFMKYVNLKLQILNKRVEEMDITRLNPNLVLNRLSAKDLTYWRLQLLKEFVEEQRRLRKFIQELQCLICVPVMADFIIFSVLMCFLFFALTAGVPSKMDYFFMFIYLFVMAGILWIYHWHATLIVECHDELSLAYFSCGWYNFELSLQRMLVFVMMHAQRPMRMRALLVDLNLRTFIDIVRGAYSYFNLLRSSHLN
ncbi:odorant receptor 56a [Drosophila subpulchrella]|uniref:odorant receptor 56a n=1 Tax=Drosophila subpulchrella TaxID=1486046 RepID=UPI0018A13204|nr:odorant receptor 56a [Drosophila subpulchrella]